MSLDLEEFVATAEQQAREALHLDLILPLFTLRENWDGYGSPPIAPEAATAALSPISLGDMIGLPLPKVSPVTGGGVHLEWEKDGRALELHIHPDHSVTYVTDGPEGLDEG